MAKTYPGSRTLISKAFITRGLPEEALEVMLSSVSKSTTKQYNVSLKNWWFFCIEHNIDIFHPTTSNIINFLNHLFHQGASYATLNATRSAINLIKNSDVDEKVVNRYLKGAFKIRPVFPKYKTTWDPSIVLDYLASLYPTSTLDLVNLTYKLVSLLALCTAQRIQTLTKIKMENIFIKTEYIEILIPEILKTSGPGKPQPKLIIPFYKTKPELCLASTLLDYCRRTESLRNNTQQLLITTKKPHHPATTQILSRWIKFI